MSDSDAELGALAERLAREGGEIARRGSSAIATHMAADTKSSSVDLVTEYDRAAEAHIVAELRHHRPDDAIVGEEGSADGGTSGLTWFIDPIDGTTNFVYGQPAWACSVAVERISVSTTADLSSTLVGTGFSYLPERRTAQAVVVAQLISEVRDIRRLGSAAYDLCLVACGRLDVYYERHLNSWDAAAGELIVREAGGVTSDYSGGTARPEEMVAANADIHGPFLAALAPFREPPAGRS
jgi:myo-inositol-1(or 4)-monophosphatase